MAEDTTSKTFVVVGNRQCPASRRQEAEKPRTRLGLSDSRMHGHMKSRGAVDLVATR